VEAEARLKRPFEDVDANFQVVPTTAYAAGALDEHGLGVVALGNGVQIDGADVGDAGDGLEPVPQFDVILFVGFDDAKAPTIEQLERRLVRGLGQCRW